METDLPCRHAQSILNAISEGVATVDTAGRISSLNRAAEVITGYNRWEAQGRPVSELFAGEHWTGKPVESERTSLLRRDGQRRTVLISVSDLRDEDRNVVGSVVSLRDLEEIEQLRKELSGRYTFHDIIGKSPAMQDLFSLLPKIAESSSSVVIHGETGTGKELVARAIHDLSPRRSHPFVAINCGALPDSLLESELFGHKAGAFTDARKDKPGRFQIAHGGTIFLDEIADISPAIQVRLLRVLQEREVEPLGSTRAVPVDVRVVAAANRRLDTLVERGTFRDDLYYRIRVIEVELPPLRRRREDIPLLVTGLIDRFNHVQGKAVSGISAEAMARLMVYSYPGNVRELENIVEQAFVLRSSGMIEVGDLPGEFQDHDRTVAGGNTLEALERTAIEEALRRAAGHRGRAAAELGIDPSTLYRKMRSLGIDPPVVDGRHH